MAVRFFEAVLLAAFFSGVGYALGRLVGVIFQLLIESEADVPGLRAIITRRSTLERNLETRVRERRKEMAALDRDIKDLVRKRIALLQDSTALKETPDRIMRLMGEEVVGRQRFLSLVYNKYADGGKSSVDSSWSTAQEIEVWSTSLPEARAELEKRYPPAFGYVVSSLVTAPAGAAEKAGRDVEFGLLVEEAS